MKVLFKSLAFLLAAHFATAQKIEVGVKGSFNFSNVSKFELANVVLGDSKILPTGGGALFIDIPLDEDFSFRPEVGYARRGTKLAGLKLGEVMNLPGWGGNLLNNLIEPRVYLDYLEVPLMIKYKFGKSENGNGYLIGGPSLNFLLDQGMRISVLGMGNMNVPLDFGFNKFEFGGQVGAGYEFPFRNNMKAFVEGKYQQGFTNIVKDLGIIDFRSRNRNFGISAGLSIPIGK